MQAARIESLEAFTALLFRQQAYMAHQVGRQGLLRLAGEETEVDGRVQLVYQGFRRLKIDPLFTLKNASPSGALQL